MNTLQDSTLTRLSKRLSELERNQDRMQKALLQCNLVACSCCGDYYNGKNWSMLNTTKGPVCVNCIRDNEIALENCKVPQRDLSLMFWSNYNSFLSVATIDGKRHVNGSPIDPSKGIRERESRDIAIVLWEFAESERVQLRSFGGHLPKYNPSDFKPEGGVWTYSPRVSVS